MKSKYFKHKQFEGDFILLCVRWYLKYTLSSRELKEIRKLLRDSLTKFLNQVVALSLELLPLIKVVLIYQQSKRLKEIKRENLEILKELEIRWNRNNEYD